MPRSVLLVPLAIVAALASEDRAAFGQSVSFAGTWTLNRPLSQMPTDMGFSVISIPAGPQGGQGGAPSGGGGGGRGGRGRGGGGTPQGSGGGQAAGGFGGPRESYEDSQRRQLLTDEARTPSAHLQITEAPGTFTIVDDQGRTRALSTTAIRQSIDLMNVPVGVSTTNIDNRYLVVYDISPDRKVRYIYSRVENPRRLVVDIDLIERNKVGDTAHLVYEPGTASTAPAPSTSTASPSGATPAAGRVAETFDQRPGAELKGLKSLGIVVEEFSATAKACGLNERTIDAAVSKRLSEGGFSITRNSDNDTYLYVNIKTDRLPDGTCLSRYDSSIYSHTTAKMSYGTTAALVQVELMHRGGISATTGGLHAPAVSRQLEGDVDLFVAQIRAANQ